jgi:hypothetical protein
MDVSSGILSRTSAFNSKRMKKNWSVSPSIPQVPMHHMGTLLQVVHISGITIIEERWPGHFCHRVAICTVPNSCSNAGG